MKCSYCGSELPEHAGFCPECGTIISLDNRFEAPEVPAQPPRSAAPAPQQEVFAAPVYVSPFPAPETQQSEPAAVQPEEEDPFLEMHPDSGYEVEEADAEGSEMYVADGRGKGKKWSAAVLVLLLIAAGAFAVKTFVIDKRPAPVDPSSDISVVDPTDDSAQTATTPQSSDEASTEPSTEDPFAFLETDESATTDPALTLSDEASTVTLPTESTEPTTTKESTTAPTTAKSTTRAQTTTRASTTRSQTTTRAATTRAHTTTRPASTTRASTTQSTTTVQRPASTTPRRTAYITADGVALRTAPRAGASSLLSLSVGADVVVTAEENGFCYVYSNRYGVSGWVKKSYVASSRPVAATEKQVSAVVAPDTTYSSPVNKSVNAHEGLRLRKGPGTSYDVIRRIGDGYPVVVKGESSSVSGWVYVTDPTHGVSGWVSSAYLH